MQRRAAARLQIGSSRRSKNAAGRSKIRSGEQQRGRKLAAADGQNHVSKRSKKRSGEVKKSAAGSSAAVNWQQQAAKIT